MWVWRGWFLTHQGVSNKEGLPTAALLTWYQTSELLLGLWLFPCVGGDTSQVQVEKSLWDARHIMLL